MIPEAPNAPLPRALLHPRWWLAWLLLGRTDRAEAAFSAMLALWPVCWLNMVA